MDVDSRYVGGGTDVPEQVPLRPLVAESWRRCRGYETRVLSARPTARPPDRPPTRPVDRPAPDGLAPVRMLGDRLRLYRAAHPLSGALPLCREVLDDLARDTGSVFAVADDAGMLLWVEGDPATRGRLEGVRFHEGADWSEESAGTNAPGTALVARSPVQIVTREHYNEAVRGWSCAAAPIIDPDTARPLGVIDLTGGPGVATPQALAAVRATARAVEADLRGNLALADASARRACGLDNGVVGAEIALLSRSGRIVQSSDRFPQDGVGLFVSGAERVTLPDGREFEIEPVAEGDYLVARRIGPWTRGPRPAGMPSTGPCTSGSHTPGSPSVGWRSAGPCVPGPRAEITALGRDRAVFEVDRRRLVLTPRHSEVVVLLALAGEGLSAARLAVDLCVDDCSDVAVRVTMTRLRKVLGDEVLGSHPYRLLPLVRCDAHAVRALVEEGRVAEALDRYGGPLLPGSEAPGVFEHRVALEQQLRGAVLASGDTRLLRRWVHTSWGSDDVSAWEQLARSLPAGSPQWAAAAARSRGLRGRG